MLRIAVLGCGRIGRMHAHNIAAPGQSDLAGVFDVHAPPAAELAAQHGATKFGKAADVTTQTGFDCHHNPIFALARQMFAVGEMSVFRRCRGLHTEDYMAGASSPYTFRHDTARGRASGSWPRRFRNVPRRCLA